MGLKRVGPRSRYASRVDEINDCEYQNCQVTRDDIAHTSSTNFSDDFKWVNRVLSVMIVASMDLNR